MAKTEWEKGDLATYQGMRTPAHGQRVTVTCVWKNGDLGVRFADGSQVGVRRHHLVAVTAPQHRPDF